MSQNEYELVDDAFKAKEEEIKAFVAEIVEAEGGIERHQARIMTLTATLTCARYSLGNLLMSLPGASGNLKKARGAWLKRAVELCGNKDRVYMASDVYSYFDDPRDSKVRASGTTGEERAKAFRGTVAALARLVKDKKDYEAAMRKRKREEAEAAKASSRIGKPAPVQGPAAQNAAKPSDENDDELTEAEDGEPDSGIVEGPEQHEAEVQNEPASAEKEQDVRAAAASDFIGLFGNDIQKAIAFLIEHHWNKADAIKWLTAWGSNERAGTKPPDTPWPPLIACGEVPPWEKAHAGQYVTWGHSRVMVIDDIRNSEIVLEDPFHPKGKYPIPATREKWDHVFTTTEDHVRSEFVRLNQKIPTEKPPKAGTGGNEQAAQNKPTRARKPAIN